MKRIFITFLLFFPLTSFAIKPMTDNEIRRSIVETSLNSKDECVCPENVNKDGKKCGNNSLYFTKNGDGSIKCYSADVTDEDVKAFREKYEIPVL